MFEHSLGGHNQSLFIFKCLCLPALNICLVVGTLHMFEEGRDQEAH
jgi:hypothetical protein